MRVTDYEFYPAPAKEHLLRVETETGLVGWGAPVVEGRPGVVEEMAGYLLDSFVVGESPLDTEDRWQAMYRSAHYRGGAEHLSAIAGIDMALWDIKGKHYGAPVYELLGGAVRDRMPVYQWTGGDSPEAAAADAASKVETGYDAVKMNATGRLKRVDSPDELQTAAAKLEAVREAVGPHVQVAIDFHGRVSKSMARPLVDALEPYDPMFIEEPMVPDQLPEFDKLADHTPVPIATGERLFSRWDFRPLLEADAVDVVQPDLSHAGGITETKKIADAAEAYDVALAPHCPLGPVTFAASLQIDARSANALVQEASALRRDTPEYLENPEILTLNDDGTVDLPDGPGLGVEVDERVLRQYDADIGWTRESWRHPDGSVAEK
jgi:galactonate dehydratase